MPKRPPIACGDLGIDGVMDQLVREIDEAMAAFESSGGERRVQRRRLSAPHRTTTISWTDHTWNPTTGCTKVSAGCAHCYAEALSLRFHRSAGAWTPANAGENVLLHTARLLPTFEKHPAQHIEPAKVFVNSMSDLFHPLIPDVFVAAVFRQMEAMDRHTFQVLTKRPERAATWPGPWPRNIWLGATVENRANLHRVDALRASGAVVRFLSCEPLLGPLDAIDLTGIAQVIVGGESGLHLTGPRHPRWMRQAWAYALLERCQAAGVAYFYKQDSDRRPGARPWLEHPDGSRWMWHQMPGDLAMPKEVMAT